MKQFALFGNLHFLLSKSYAKLINFRNIRLIEEQTHQEVMTFIFVIHYEKHILLHANKDQYPRIRPDCISAQPDHCIRYALFGKNNSHIYYV